MAAIISAYNRLESMEQYIAFFDLDDTILDTNSSRYFVKEAYRSGLLKNRDLIRAYFLSLVFKLGLVEPEHIITRMSMWLKGLPEKKIIDLSHRVFDMSVKHAIRRPAQDEIRHHKKSNGKTVLLSAATRYICDLVQDYIGMDDTVCTELEVVDGSFTGLPMGDYCYGEAKLHRVQAYCKAVNGSLENAYYYADAYSDLPVLEMVGRPVCVSPEPKLLIVAQERGWPVYEW